ncbi:MAG TPA: hypothetical protein VF480_07100 [Verrucomicrobiae bacterium]
MSGDATFPGPRRKKTGRFYFAPFALDFRIEEQKVMPSGHDKST